MSTKKDRLTINYLNDDCLELILRYVGGSLNQQIKLSQVCKRFLDVYTDRIWRCPINHLILKPNDQRNVLGPVDFKNFMHGMQNRFVELDLREVNLNWFLMELSDSKVVSLPHLTVCSLKNFNSMLHYAEFNQDFVTLTKTTLPNLRCLQMFTHVENRNFEHLRNLKEFHLMDAETKMDLQYFQGICEQMRDLKILEIKAPIELNNSKDQCSTWDLPMSLETLKLHKTVLPAVQKQLGKLHNLHQLSFLNNSAMILPCDLSTFYDIVTENRDLVNGLAFNNRFDCYRAVWHILRDLLTNEGSRKTFGNLEMLCLRDCSVLKNEDISKMMKVFTNLTHLDLFGCQQLNVDSLLFKILKSLRKREDKTKPLTVYGLKSFTNEKSQAVYSSQKFLHFGERYPVMIGENVLMMHWK